MKRQNAVIFSCCLILACGIYAGVRIKEKIDKANIKKELNNPSLKVIATGGLTTLISSYCEENIDIIDGLLTLKGILNIYNKNI